MHETSPGTAPANPNVAPFNSRNHDRLCRAGLWLGVLAAGLAAVPGFSEGAVAEQGFRAIFYESALFISVGVIFAVLLLLAVLLPYAWARIAGIGVLGIAAFTYAVIVVTARSDVLLDKNVAIDLGPAGTMQAIAFLVTCVAMALALVGSPRIGRPAKVDAEGNVIRAQSGYSVTSLVLSLCSLVVLFTAPLGVAFAIATFDDDERSKGARTGKGMAIAGLVVGLVVVVIGALIMGALIATADPSLNEP